MDINMTIYNLTTGGVASKATQEGIDSQLPGRENGPADAYRHLLLSAELTRRYGEGYARSLLEGHELTGNMGDQQPDADAMDRNNNELGIEIGKELQNNI